MIGNEQNENSGVNHDQSDEDIASNDDRDEPKMQKEKKTSLSSLVKCFQQIQNQHRSNLGKLTSQQVLVDKSIKGSKGTSEMMRTAHKKAGGMQKS